MKSLKVFDTVVAFDLFVALHEAGERVDKRVLAGTGHHVLDTGALQGDLDLLVYVVRVGLCGAGHGRRDVVWPVVSLLVGNLLAGVCCH